MSRRGFYMLLVAIYLIVAFSACSDGGDATKKDTGDPCQNNTDCADNVCHDGMCAAASPKENGEACTSAAECLSYVCSHSKCEAGTKSVGTACLNGQECTLGSCVNNVCADSGQPDAGVDGSLLPDGALPTDGSPPAGMYFFDDFSAGFGKWTCGTGWGTTTDTYNSGPASLTDTPSGNYLPSADSDCRLAKSLDLSTATAPMLTFFHKHDLLSISSGSLLHWDTAYVEVSADGGFNWTEVKKYTMAQATWSFEQVDLTPHISAKMKVRFRLMSHSDSSGADGWYIDDVRIEELP